MVQLEVLVKTTFKLNSKQLFSYVQVVAVKVRSFTTELEEYNATSQHSLLDFRPRGLQDEWYAIARGS